MKKQPERTAKTKEIIRNAFWKLYCTNKIEKITIKEISAEADISRSTFYEYFSDIYEVLEEIEDEIMSEITDAMQQMLTSENIEQGVNHIFSFYQVYGEQMAVLLGMNGDQQFYAKLRKSLQLQISKTVQINFEDSKADMLFTVMSSTIFALLQYWYENKDSVELSEVLLTYSKILQEGALPYLREYNIPFLR
ncbi:MAG: TetR/AcrR family transcriptional regulator [Firmicutes bacterium]|nr:TetR/AcrR family transcriptional regulator [Bacillota bacterium]